MPCLIVATLFFCAAESNAQPGNLPVREQDSSTDPLPDTTRTNDGPPAAVFDVDPVRQAFSRSFRAEGLADYPAAIAALTELGEQPDHAYAIKLRLGWLHYLNRDYETSGRFYRAAAQIAPRATEPRVGYLLPLIAEQRYDQAEIVARQVLTVDPNDYFANLRLAIALRSQHKFDEAEKISSRMLDLKPTDVSFLAERARIAQDRQDTDAATAAFRDVLLLDPDNDAALDYLGLEAPPTADAPYDPTRTGDYFGPECYPLTGSITPYYAYLDYGAESIKNHGQVAGLYGYLLARHSLEGAVEYTNLRFQNSTNLEQQDYTLAYTYRWRPKMKLRFGGHFIDNTDLFSDDGWTVTLGGYFVETGKWDIGLDAYYSGYPNHPINGDIVQLTPRVGVEVSPQDRYRVRLDARLYWINTGHEVFNVGQQDFLSLEASVRFERDPWKFALIGWTGEQVFAVRRDGFTIYNLGELHTGGYGGEITCRLIDTWYFSVRIADEFFSDITNLIGTHQLVTTALVTRDF